MGMDDFTFYIIQDKCIFHHRKLVELINSIVKEDKIELEEYVKNFRKFFPGRNIKITWGGNYRGLPKHLNISNLLTCIDAGNRELLYIDELDDIERGYLTYYGHNLNDKSRTFVYSVLSRYISILNQKAIKLYKY